jgi:hypothetical protein
MGRIVSVLYTGNWNFFIEIHRTIEKVVSIIFQKWGCLGIEVKVLGNQ